MPSRFATPRFFSAALFAVALAAASPAVHAEDAADTARATELFKRGKTLYVAERLPEAERAFSDAFQLRKSADIATNLAQTELELGQYSDAAFHFSWALANFLPSATDAQRKAAEEGLARARAEVGVLKLTVVPEGAEISVDDAVVGPSPLTTPLFVSPGQHTIRATKEGHKEALRRVTLGKGAEDSLRLELEPFPQAEPVTAAPATAPELTEPPPHAEDRGTKKSLVPAFVAAGVAVAGGVTGLVFTVRANSKEDDADALSRGLGTRGCTGVSSDACDDLKSKRESVDSSRNLALGAFIVGGVGAAAATYFFIDALSHDSSESASASARRIRVQPLVAPTAAAFSVSGAF